VNALEQALREKFGTPDKALAALGLPADLLAADQARTRRTPSRSTPMKRTMLSSTALRAHAAMTALLAPHLAADAKLDLVPAVRGITRKNLKANASKVWARAKAAGLKAGLAADQMGPDDVAMKLLSMIDGQGAEPEIAAAEPDPAQQVEEGTGAEPDAGLEPNAAPPPAAGAGGEAGKPEPGEGEDEEEDDGELDAEILRLLQEHLGDDAQAEELHGLVKSAMDKHKHGKDEVVNPSATEVPAKTAPAADRGKKGKDNEMPTVTQGAMDQAIAASAKKVREDMRREAREAQDARAFVRPLVGEVSPAFDSAQDIYEAALKSLHVDLKGVHPSAYRSLLGALPRGSRAQLAQDEALSGKVKKPTSGASKLTGRITVMR